MGKRKSMIIKNHALVRFFINKGDEAYKCGDYDNSILLFDAAVEEILQSYLGELYNVDWREDLEEIVEELEEKKADSRDIQLVFMLAMLRHYARLGIPYEECGSDDSLEFY